MSDLYSKSGYESIYKEPCRCVICDECGGTGNVWRNYDPLGRYVSDCGMDDLSELEPCESCNGGIAEVCDRCQLLDEMDHDAEEYHARQGGHGVGQ